jgi:peptidase E
MKKTFIFFSFLLQIVCGYSQTQTIFAFGGDINQKFVQYVVDLTEKSNPKICFVPTASADNADNIKYWNFICKNLGIDSYILKFWISSNSEQKTFEQILLDADAIVVGGGNTLNMMGIWKAQGIDMILQKALKRGIILAGGSAGSLCWFENGVSDSRPVNLSIVDGFGFLPYSHCPHYSNEGRKELYFDEIESGRIKNGYACDDKSGVLFKNGKFIEAISTNDVNNSYYITLKDDKINSQKLDSKILINKDALLESDYKSIEINKKINGFSEIFNQDTPLDAFISIKYLLANGQNSKLNQVSAYSLQERLGNMSDTKSDENKKNSILNVYINKILIYNNYVAGIINKFNPDYYGLWYFYNEDGKWMSAGEDIGGATMLESEITFREKAKIHASKVKTN